MVELLVEGKSLDVFPNEVISLVLAINDLASIKNREGNYSNKFEIPSTSSNNKVLGYPNELNLITGFRPTKSRNAVILIDGLDIERGFIQVEQYNSKSKSFNVSFFSGNTDWMDDISDRKLSEIKLSKYDHVWSAANVAASMSNTEGYIYPLIDYGRYFPTSDNNTELVNWMPAMYTHTLVRQMFADIGWKVGGSTFLDPIFNKHIIPFSLKEINVSQDILDNNGFGSQNATGSYAKGSPIIFPDVVSGNNLGNYDNTTGVYTATESFTASIYAYWFYSSSKPAASTRIQIRVNGSVVLQVSGWVIQGSIGISQGDTVHISVNATNQEGTNGTKIQNNKFYLTPLNEISDGVTLRISDTLPDMTQEDFIKTIFNQFGIIFTSDNLSKTVYLNRFEDIKNNIGKAIDWTDKVDISRDIEIDYTELVSGYGKVNTYGYEKNVDNQITPSVKPFGGNGSFVINNDFLSKEEEIFNSEFTYSDNKVAFNGRINLMYIPRFTSHVINEKSPDFDPLPRCSICVNDISVSDIFSGLETSLNIVGDNGTSNVTTVPYTYFNASFYGIPDVDDVNQSLSFGDNIIPKGHRNLLESYYPDYINILNNPRRVTGYFLLNERDINNLDFLVPIYLGGQLNNYFYINKVSDYRPSEKGVTKVELILIV